MAGADRFEDLLTWQRMFELSVEVLKFTAVQPAARDFKYCGQIRDASESAHRNVAEGFGRYYPGEFVRFLDVARASAQETRALLMTGRSAGYLTPQHYAELDRLAVRGLQALARLQRYLRSADAKRNAQRARYSRNRPDGGTKPNDSNHPNDPNDSNHPNAANDPNDPNAPNDPND